jgi:hypothetical protein
MNFETKQDLLRGLMASEEWMLHRVFAHLIYEAFLRVVVIEYYGFRSPEYVTLQVESGQATLFVWEGKRVFSFQDEMLTIWVQEFIVEEVLSIAPESIEIITISGTLDTTDPYLYISGKDLLIESGVLRDEGRYLS